MILYQLERIPFLESRTRLRPTPRVNPVELK
jgi:hypothetical protein